MEVLYTSKEFEGEKAFSRMMSIVFVIFIYSSGMPILYLVGAFFCGITYFTNKFLILKYYKRSTTITRTVPLTMIKYLNLALLLHMIFGLFMLTQSNPFEVKEAPDKMWFDQF